MNESPIGHPLRQNWMVQSGSDTLWTLSSIDAGRWGLTEDKNVGQRTKGLL
jgi:hypothetical protein